MTDLAFQLVRDATAELRPSGDASYYAILRAYGELLATVESDLAHQVAAARSFGYSEEEIAVALRLGRRTRAPDACRRSRVASGHGRREELAGRCAPFKSSELTTVATPTSCWTTCTGHASGSLTDRRSFEPPGRRCSCGSSTTSTCNVVIAAPSRGVRRFVTPRPGAWLKSNARTS